MKRMYWPLAILILVFYAYAELRGLDFPTGEREVAAGGLRGVRRSGYFGGK